MGTQRLPKVITILGPTASGKSDWAHNFAKKYNGEIIVADSRQVYKDFNIGTNKDKGIYKKIRGKNVFIGNGIPHHLTDCVDPTHIYTVYEFKNDTEKCIKDITNRDRVPLIVGGTGMYIRAVTENWKLTKVKSEARVREQFEEKSNIELVNELKKISPEKAETIDKHNKSRLIRALEVYAVTGKVLEDKPPTGKKKFDFLKIGIKIERDVLIKKINKRVDIMIQEGLIEEVESLLKKYDKKLPVFLGIGYKQIIDYFDGKYSREEAIEQIKIDTRRYARRQMTWWKRELDIHWFSDRIKASNEIEMFLKK